MNYLSPLAADEATLGGTAVAFEEYTIPITLIGHDGYFRVRAVSQDPHHVKALAARIRAAGALDPILLWQSRRGLVLLDGAHRFAAYAEAAWTERIPTRIATCDRRTALLLAIQANSKTTLAMSNSERWDAAWRLVREEDRNGRPLYVKREITEATGTSKGTVDAMRGRWRTFREACEVPSGSWRRDRGEASAWNPGQLTDEEREQASNAMMKELQKAFNVRGTADDHLMAEALFKAVGELRLRGWIDYLFGEDADLCGTPEGEPEEDLSRF